MLEEEENEKKNDTCKLMFNVFVDFVIVYIQQIRQIHEPNILSNNKHTNKQTNIYERKQFLWKSVEPCWMPILFPCSFCLYTKLWLFIIHQSHTQKRIHLQRARDKVIAHRSAVFLNEIFGHKHLLNFIRQTPRNWFYYLYLVNFFRCLKKAVIKRSITQCFIVRNGILVSIQPMSPVVVADIVVASVIPNNWNRFKLKKKSNTEKVKRKRRA